MAASGYTPIQLYRTATASAAPVAGNLTSGELAINYNAADMALYAKNGSGSVIRLMNNPAGLKYPTADGTNGQVLTTNGSGVLSWASAAAGFINGSGTTNYVPKFTSSSAIGNSVIYDDGTNVGIGTSSPGKKLDVVGTVRANPFVETTDGTVTGIFGSAAFNVGVVGIGSTSNHPLVFGTNSSEKMRLDASGNVGIGTSSPSYKLDIVNTTSNGIRVASATSDTYILNDYYASGVSSILTGAGSSKALAFGVNSSERMRIDSSGNVGIGTSSPDPYFKLDVAGNAMINGVEVGIGSSSGTNNTVLGASSFSNTTIGNGNVAIGYSTLDAVDIGNYNVAVGSQAMSNGEGSYSCIAIGRQANYNNYYESDSVYIGDRAGYSSVQSVGIIAIGSNALYSNGQTSNNIAIGVNAMYYPYNANTNIAIGNGTINGAGGNSDSANNTALGHYALSSLSEGYSNCAVGQNALYTSVNGSTNVAVGVNAGYKVTSGESNTFIGYGAGNGASGTTSGVNNTCIGAGSNTTAATVNNQFILGNSSVSALRCQVSLTVVSDARDKTNFQPLPSVLSFVDKLQPIKFDWNARDGGRVGSNDIGFTAQDLQQAQQDAGFTVPNLVNDDAPEKLGVTYSTLIPVLVKAIQEQQVLINQLTARIAVLEEKA